MEQNKKRSQWPKAIVAILGTASISAASYFLVVPQIMWSMIILYFIVDSFD